MDPYARMLSQHLGVPNLSTDIYEKDDFGAPLFGRLSAQMAWEHARFVLTLRRTQQPLHLPNQHFGRYGLFLSRPYIVTVFDLIRYFDLLGSEPLISPPNIRDRFYLRLDYAGIRRATAIIAASHTTKRDLVERLHLPKSRVFVTYQGLDHDLFQRVERRIVDGPYILFVGSENPRKNLATLLRAFRVLKNDSRFGALKLVKVGSAGSSEAPFRKSTEATIAELGLEGDVLFTERVRARDLSAYYSGASCLVLPSLYEGFGLPPLEAMACGCPVIVSNAGSLPEVIGDAGFIVNPHDWKALASALERVLVDTSTRLKLIDEGLRHAAEFTWERTVRETLAVYQHLGF